MKQFFKKNLQLIAISAGHFTNDFYMNLLPPILFAFSRSLGWSLAQQSMVAFVVVTGGTLFQPLVGYLLDKVGKSSYLMIGLIWISFMMSITGLISNFYLLVIVAGLASIASSLYHPLGSSIAVNLAEGSRGKSLSIFMTIGGLARTFSPMVSIPIVNIFGLKALVFFMIPGFLVAYFLKFAEIDKIKNRVAGDTQEKKDKRKKVSRNKIKWLTLLVCMHSAQVMLERIIIVFGVQIMVMKAIGVIPAGIILSAFMFLRSVGTLAGGHLSDSFGEIKILIVFNILTCGIYTIALFSQGAWVITGIILLGFTLNATLTAEITISHQILPENINLGTGTIMGFPGTIAGLLMLVFGKFSDIFGLMKVAQLTTCLSLVPVILSFYLLKKIESLMADTV